MTPADEAMLSVATEMGAGGSSRLAPVGVLFGTPGTPAGVPLVPTGGAGPHRRTCVQCGECMTGCRKGAKNTLLTNYLYLAERAGATVMPLTNARSLSPLEGGGWSVAVSGSSWSTLWQRRTITAEQVVLAAGAYGTQRLLHAMALEGKLPDSTPRLGYLTRTNSESLLGAVVPRGRRHPDFTRGVAITSSFHPEPGTHVEPVRYGHGSNMMGLLGTLLVEGPAGPEDERSGRGRFMSALRRQPWASVARARPACLVGTDGHRPGHAGGGQFAHVVRPAGPARSPQVVQPAGPRHPQPDLAPDRSRGGPSLGGQDKRRAGGDLGRDIRGADDSPLPGRMRYRRLALRGRRRPVAPRLRLRRSSHPGRLRRARQPGREPGPDDHRPR